MGLKIHSGKDSFHGLTVSLLAPLKETIPDFFCMFLTKLKRQKKLIVDIILYGSYNEGKYH